jgi:hypothetical protein
MLVSANQDINLRHYVMTLKGEDTGPVRDLGVAVAEIATLLLPPIVETAADGIITVTNLALQGIEIVIAEVDAIATLLLPPIVETAADGIISVTNLALQGIEIVIAEVDANRNRIGRFTIKRDPFSIKTVWDP